MSKLTFEFTVNTETGEFTVTNTETGEIKSTKPKTVRSTKKKSTLPENEALIELQDNKYVLNNLALDLLQVEAGERIEIKFDKKGKTVTPVIGKSEIFGTSGGNKLNKSNSVSYRGKARDELVKYGTTFKLKPHDKVDGLFYMIGDAEVEEPVEEANVVFPDDSPETDRVEDLSLDLDGLVDNPDDVEVSSLDFSL